MGVKHHTDYMMASVHTTNTTCHCWCQLGHLPEAVLVKSTHCKVTSIPLSLSGSQYLAGLFPLKILREDLPSHLPWEEATQKPTRFY